MVVVMMMMMMVVTAPVFNDVCVSLQRNSISPAEREKYRPRTPQEPTELKKLKKEEKDLGHVSTYIYLFKNSTKHINF